MREQCNGYMNSADAEREKVTDLRVKNALEEFTKNIRSVWAGLLRVTKPDSLLLREKSLNDQAQRLNSTMESLGCNFRAAVYCFTN